MLIHDLPTYFQLVYVHEEIFRGRTLRLYNGALVVTKEARGFHRVKRVGATVFSGKRYRYFTKNIRTNSHIL